MVLMINDYWLKAAQGGTPVAALFKKNSKRIL